MRGSSLEQAIEEDLANGLVPFFVCSTIGTTSSCAVDNLEEIIPVCQKYQLWNFVDAAYAGAALVCPEYRYLIKDIHQVDSFNMNCSKMLLVNFDCSCLWIKNRKDLIDSLSLTPEYLRSKEYDSGLVVDYRDWQIPLGRRFRSLKLWFSIRRHGAKQIREYIRKMVGLGQMFARFVEADDRFEMAAPQFLALTCFRLKSGDSKKLLDLVNAESGIYMVHTMLDDKIALRFVPGSPWTEERHVERAWAEIQKQATRVLADKAVD